MSPRLRSVLAAAAAAVLLAGCRAEVATTVEVTGENTATIEVAAVFTDEAAAALAESPQARSNLNDLFASRAGSRPVVVVDEDRVTATVTVPYERVADLAEVTGVSSLALDEDGTVTRVGFVPAAKLVATITEQNAAEPDAAALTATMLENTFLVVRVRYAGGVADAVVVDESGSPVAGADVTAGERTASFTRTAAQDDAAGQFVVSGDVSGFPVRFGLLVGGGLLLLAAAGWWLRRR